MKLTTFRDNRTGAARVGLQTAGGLVDVGAALDEPGLTLRDLIARDFSGVRGFQGPLVNAEPVVHLPLIPDPSKIICVGLNYRDHADESAMAPSAHPVLFLRVADSQVGHGEAIIKPGVSDALDFEGELAVIVGKPGRHISAADALNHVAGYACYNDASVRDWQTHTPQFTPGKNFHRTGAFGPWLVTADEIADVTALTLTTRLNGAVVQQATTDLMLFPIPQLIAYISTFTPLNPGDVIVSGTPAGVGAARKPPLWMKAGDVVEVEITGVGVLRNTVALEGAEA